jgi:hypothetical protein
MRKIVGWYWRFKITTKRNGGGYLTIRDRFEGGWDVVYSPVDEKWAVEETNKASLFRKRKTWESFLRLHRKDPSIEVKVMRVTRYAK